MFGHAGNKPCHCDSLWFHDARSQTLIRGIAAVPSSAGSRCRRTTPQGVAGAAGKLALAEICQLSFAERPTVAGLILRSLEALARPSSGTGTLEWSAKPRKGSQRAVRRSDVALC